MWSLKDVDIQQEKPNEIINFLMKPDEHHEGFLSHGTHFVSCGQQS